MKLKEIAKCLTKYYGIYIANNSAYYEDQTVISGSALDGEVETLDFYDCADGEMLFVNLREEKVDDRQITFDELKE